MGQAQPTVKGDWPSEGLVVEYVRDGRIIDAELRQPVLDYCAERRSRTL
jgi:hypothetical protein